MNKVYLYKVYRILRNKFDSLLGIFYPLDKTLEAMVKRPFELHLELTNLCNAKCIFCPYQFQERETEFMSDKVFYKAVKDYTDIGGGSVMLTPIVGDALIDPKFLERVRYLRSIKCIDRIKIVTNGILLDKHGIEEILNSGLTEIDISTAGFDEEMYTRVYRSNAYKRMKTNVEKIVELNSKKKEPILITIALRSDRPLKEVLQDKDFQPILKYNPIIDFTWSYSDSGGRITKEMLSPNMKLRKLIKHSLPCVNLFNGPIVLPDGIVMACSCSTAMDATNDLGIGNIMDSTLLEIWRSHKMLELRKEFGTSKLNNTCKNCDAYRKPDLYRTFEGRERAKINLERLQGKLIFRDKPTEPFSGG